jgi:hypothetical protein
MCVCVCACVCACVCVCVQGVVHADITPRTVLVQMDTRDVDAFRIKVRTSLCVAIH